MTNTNFIPAPRPTLETRATNIINQLKQSFLNDESCFDFHCSQYISGDVNRVVRQEIARQLTGEKMPLAKCCIYKVADLMKASFKQYSLFIQ